jgi:hypothetical protein
LQNGKIIGKRNSVLRDELKDKQNGKKGKGNMNNGIKYLVVGLAVTGLAMSAHALPITVNWGAADVTGISLAGGNTPLPAGDLLEVGTFNGPMVGSSLANFLVFGTAVSAGGASIPGFWNATTIADEGTFGHSNIFIVAFNNSTGINPGQQGVWTAVGNTAWVFPKASDIPSLTGIDLEDAVTAPGTAGATIKPGSQVFGGGIGFVASDPNDVNTSTSWLRLAVVPEPSTYVLVATGLLGLLGLRRRRS